MSRENNSFDVEWYFRENPERERFYEIFFAMCRKHNIKWENADEEQKALIEKLTWEAFENEHKNNDYA